MTWRGAKFLPVSVLVLGGERAGWKGLQARVARWAPTTRREGEWIPVSGHGHDGG